MIHRLFRPLLLLALSLSLAACASRPTPTPYIGTTFAVAAVQSSSKAILLLEQADETPTCRVFPLNAPHTVVSMCFNGDQLIYATHDRTRRTSHIYRLDPTTGTSTLLKQHIPGSASALLVRNGTVWYASDKVLGTVGGREWPLPFNAQPVAIAMDSKNIALVGFNHAIVFRLATSDCVVYRDAVSDLRWIGNGCRAKITNCPDLPACEGHVFLANGNASCTPPHNAPTLRCEIAEPSRTATYYVNGHECDGGSWRSDGGVKWVYRTH